MTHVSFGSITMSLKTVHVPKELEPVFAKAEAAVAAYFRARKDDPTKGTIDIMDQRYVLVRAAALSVDFFLLVRRHFGEGNAKKADDFAQSLLFDLAHSIGQSDAKNFHSKMNLQDPIEKLSAGPVHFAHSGWAFVDISPDSHPSPDEEYMILYDHPYSFEADAWIKSKNKADFPVCVMNAGYSSGWCEESFGIPLVASEILCRAKGDAYCRFIMAPPSRIESHIKSHIRENPAFASLQSKYEMPNFLTKRRIEEQLRQTERQYQDIFNLSMDTILILDCEGKIVQANAAASDMYGYTRQELIGFGAGDLIYSSEHGVFKELKQQMDTIGQFQTEAAQVRKDGTVFDVDARGIRINYKQNAGHFLCILRDITESKKARDELRESEEKFRMLFDKATDGILLGDPREEDPSLIMANPMLCRMLGYTQEEITNLHVSDIHPREDLSHVREQFKKQAKGEIQLANDIPVKRKDGSVFYADINAAPVRIKEQDYLMGFFRDITERKEAENEKTQHLDKISKQAKALEKARDGLERRVAERTRELTKANQQLQQEMTERKRAEEELRQAQKMKAIGHLAGGIAHDFNNLLTGITGFADLLHRELTDRPDLSEMAEEIMNTAQRAADLTSQLLAFSRRGRVRSVPVDLHEVIQEVIRLLKRTIDPRIEIVMYPKISIALTMGDPTQLQNALLNLAVNACDAMPAGGKLIFETKVVVISDGDEASQSLKVQPGRYLELRVSDTGMGIDKETVPYIFEPFFTTKELDKGTGLGLSAVYGTVKEHHGTIDVYSSAGEGTTFILRLPFVEDVVMPAKETAVGRPVSSGKGRILVVDDEAVVRKFASTLLAALGYDVILAQDGQEAVDIYNKEHKMIDLVLLDLMMPKMNGKEALQEIRKINSAACVLISSGFGRDAQIEEILQQGVCGFVQKPYDAADLSHKIAERLHSTENP